MAWNCPYAVRFKGAQSLGCRKAMKGGVDYNLRENQLTAFCACQRYCPDCKQVINSDGAKQCYEYHSRE